MTPFSGSASPALESRYSRCSVFESRSSEDLRESASSRSWWRPSRSLTPFSGSASPALESRYSRCSVFESRSSEDLLANPAPPEAGGGQAGVQEVPVQPSSPGIPAAQFSSLGALRTCSRIRLGLLQKLVEAKPEFDTFLRKCQSSPRVQVFTLLSLRV